MQIVQDGKIEPGKNSKSNLNRVARPQHFSCFAGEDGSIDREPVKMIEASGMRPPGKKFFSQLHELLLKTGSGLAAFRVARRHDATLAGVVAGKFYRADLERLELVGRAEEPVFAKRLAVHEFKICAKTAAQTFQRQLGKPFLDFAQAGLARDGRARRHAVVRETFLWFVPERDGKSKKFTQPFFNPTWRVQVKLRWRHAALPQADFLDF